MNDVELQRLHDTLEMLKPKGRTGGLGRGTVGVAKKAEDGLPKNALYSHFVRQGAADLQHQRFDDDAKEKKKKKDAKKAKKGVVDDSAASDPIVKRKRKADDAGSEDRSTEKSGKKKGSTQRSAAATAAAVVDDVEEGGCSEDALAAWVEAIKSCLKSADNKKSGLETKALRKAVQSSLEATPDSSVALKNMDKKQLKKVFALALSKAGPKVVVDDAAGTVRYAKKSKK
jgi:hypothetical protein